MLWQAIALTILITALVLALGGCSPVSKSLDVVYGPHPQTEPQRDVEPEAGVGKHQGFSVTTWFFWASARALACASAFVQMLRSLGITCELILIR